MAYNNPISGQPQVQYPAPMVFYAAPTGNYQPMVIKNFGPHYKRQTSTGLGATQIVLSCASIAAGIIAILTEAGWYYIGVGIWAGAWVSQLDFSTRNNMVKYVITYMYKSPSGN